MNKNARKKKYQQLFFLTLWDVLINSELNQQRERLFVLPFPSLGISFVCANTQNQLRTDHRINVANLNIVFGLVDFFSFFLFTGTDTNYDPHEKLSPYLMT